MLYIHRFSIFDNPEVSKEDKISQSDFHQPLQEGQGDITLSQLRADIEENKLKLSEMRDRQSSKNFYGKILTIFICLILIFLFYRILRFEHVFNQWKDMEKYGS
ncbi:unnamed protein product [Meloidogyne enterolobii]|uniref:Uncharacterized protein n=1 Tax=Meloidogyne enterolobii TaxID=390850 RepID=A0ACB1ATT4_MELEN